MRSIARTVVFGLALAIAGTGVTVAVPAWADSDGNSKQKGKSGKSSNKDNDRSNNRGRDQSDDRGSRSSAKVDFRDNDRDAIRDYFDDRAKRGQCPPGLAKKDNGCLPPGLAKNQDKPWTIGQPLPRNVVFYDLPADLVRRISPPPAGYRHVRVADDVLTILSRNGQVASAIENLARNARN